MLLKKQTKIYNKENFTPALHSSICTGEKVAGFIDNKTGRFKDVMLIRNERDLNCFLREYGIKKSDLKSDF